MKILFTSSLDTSFIREDLSILNRHYAVDRLVTKGFLAPLVILMHVLKADVTFTWFASVYSFFVVLSAKMFGKPSIIVIGGADASKEPAINYGIWLSPWKSVLVGWAMRHADKLLIVDPFFRDEIIRLAEYDGNNIEYVPTGYDAAIWQAGQEKDTSVLTVAVCHDEWRMKKKGIDVLLESARRFPDIQFRVVGIAEALIRQMKSQLPSNVELIASVPRADLLRYYQRAKVYCQPSFTEGLPNSLCEAMLCECIPVGTSVGGIPTALDGVGVLVPYGNVDALVAGLAKAMEMPDTVGTSARKHIAEHFTLTRREESLVKVIQELRS